MRALSLLIGMALVSGCVDIDSDKQRLIDSDEQRLMKLVEAQIVLPDGAASLDKYERYYAFDSKGDVVGSYMIYPSNWPTRAEETRRLCKEHAESAPYAVFPCPIGNGELRHVRAGESAWLRGTFELPYMSDGGCAQITFKYLAWRKKFEYVKCNGKA